jgi:glycosyltransferase involved in cell wall biosynthesis
VSDYTKREFSNNNDIDSNKIKILPDALDYYWPENFDPDCKNHNFILCVSRLNAEDGYYKGIDDLIHSFSTISTCLPQYSLIIVGDGTDIDRLKKLAIDEQISHKVKFLGNVPDEELRELYRNCTIFALPSKKEGFGIVFLEAMASKKPVIAGNHGGAPEIIEDGKTGLLVNHANHQETSAALEQLLVNEELRIVMGENGYKKLQENYLYRNFELALFTYLSNLVIQKS